MKFFNIYSNGHSREFCLESRREIFTIVVDATTVNLIRPGCRGRSSKNPQSSGITILNSTKTCIPSGGDGRSTYLNSVDIYSVDYDPFPARE